MKEGERDQGGEGRERSGGMEGDRDQGGRREREIRRDEGREREIERETVPVCVHLCLILKAHICDGLLG